jgi:hypothetical protein
MSSGFHPAGDEQDEAAAKVKKGYPAKVLCSFSASFHPPVLAAYAIEVHLT